MAEAALPAPAPVMDRRRQADALPWGRGVRARATDPNGLVAVAKPEGVLSHPNRRGDERRSLLKAPYDLRREAYQVAVEGFEGPVFLLNRLDSATSGIVLLALSEATREAVAALFRRREVDKRYCALVFGAPPRAPALWKDRLAAERSGGKVRTRVAPGGAAAETRLIGARPVPGPFLASLLWLQPLTGRAHQLRAQCAKRGLPIAGDRTYGDYRKNKAFRAQGGAKRLHLHCASVSLEYALGGRKRRFRAEEPCPFEADAS